MAMLARHKVQIEAINLGAEFFVYADYLTDNLIVHDGKRGFVVTHICLDTWPLEKLTDSVKVAFQALLAGLDVDQSDVKILPLGVLMRQRLEP